MANSGSPFSGTVAAEPTPIDLDWSATALLIIDMQRDFMEPGGFGETLGNDVAQLARAVKPIAAVLAAARANEMLVVHTREGHLPDLSDAPPAKGASAAPMTRARGGPVKICTRRCIDTQNKPGPLSSFSRNSQANIAAH